MSVENPEQPAQGRTRRRVLFISELPCRASAVTQLSAALGREVVPVQRPASQLLANARLARGYDVAVVHQVPFALHSKVLEQLVRSDVPLVLVPEYQGAEQASAESKPKVVGYRPMTTPAFQPR